MGTPLKSMVFDGSRDGDSLTRLAVLVQCGFPEAHQCEAAVAICRLFAARTGMRWAGALAMGMWGPVAGGIASLPGGGRHIVRALGAAAESLARGGDVPEEAAALFARPLMPRWIYSMVGNLGWRLQLPKNKAAKPLGYRPCERDRRAGPAEDPCSDS